MIKNYVIDVKDYNGVLRFDTHTGRSFSDVSYQNGKVYFKGTKEELDAYEMELFKKGIKIIGSRENDMVNIEVKPVVIEEPKEKHKLTSLEVIEEVKKQLHRLNLIDTKYEDRFYSVLFAIDELKTKI